MFATKDTKQQSGTLASASKTRDNPPIKMQRTEPPLDALHLLQSSLGNHYLQTLSQIQTASAEPTEILLRERPYHVLLYTSSFVIVLTTIPGVIQFAGTVGVPPPPSGFAMGFTSPRVAIARPVLNLVREDRPPQGTFWHVQQTTASIDVDARAAQPGDHDIGTAETEGTACTPPRSGTVRLRAFFNVSDRDSQRAVAAEQDHCNDFIYAFERTFARRSREINQQAGTPIGPTRTEASARRQAERRISRTDAECEREFRRLAEQTDRRDSAPRFWHTFVDAPASVDAACTRITIPLVPAPTFRTGVPPANVIR